MCYWEGNIMSNNLFVYGTLMDDTLREVLFGEFTFAVPATLCDYKIIRNLKYPYIIQSIGDSVTGCLLDLTDTQLKISDYYENVPELYIREKVEIVVSNKIIDSWVYVRG